MKFFNFLLVGGLFFCLGLNCVFGSLFFSGVEYNQNLDLSKINSFNFNATIINSDNKVYADTILSYNLVSVNNYEVVAKGNYKFSMAENEVKFLNDSINLNTINSGKYWFNILISEQSGAIIAGMQYLVNFTGKENNLRINITKGPYLIGIDDEGKKIQESYGTLGNNMPKNSSKYLVFNLQNSRLKSVEVLVELYNTYSIENKIYETQKNINLNSSEVEDKVLIDYDIPGTYIVRTTFFDNEGNFLFLKDIRLVIAGISGSIVGVKNGEDIYSVGDSLDLSGVLIGSADGASKLNNVDLELLIYQNDELILTNSKKIESLGFEPTNFIFEDKINVDLTNYKVIINLKKDSTVLDTIELNYEELRPEFLYKDGRIIQNGIVACFDDNKCTAEEREMGDCYDCYLEDNDLLNKQKEEPPEVDSTNKDVIDYNKNEYVLFIWIIVGLICIGSCIFAYLFWRNKNEK